MHSTKHKVSHALIALAVLFSVHTLAFAQLRSMQGWIWQNPLPQGNTLFSINFAPDKLTGWAVGADGVIVEVHPEPEKALSDGAQSLTFSGFRELIENLQRPLRAVHGLQAAMARA